MTSLILPDSLRPGSDLMSKTVVRHPKIINIITTALIKTRDKYYIGDSEWHNGTRSDLVFEPQSSSLGLAPIIIEFQHSVDNKFMKRAINYCLQAFNRYGVDPILLVVCIDFLTGDIDQLTQPSRVPGCYTFPCDCWASECFVLCQSSINECNTTQQPLDPFIALGLFLTQRAASIINFPCRDDPTIKLLYTLAMNHYESLAGNQPHLIDMVKDLCDTQNYELETVLDLLKNDAPSETVAQIIKNAQIRNHDLKMNYADMGDHRTPSTSSSSSTTAAAESTSSSATDPTSSSTSSHLVVQSSSSSAYQRGMEFVEQFKKARQQQGFKQMDWVTCLSEGRKRNLLNYKNHVTLRNQFAKYEKNKNK